MRQNGEERGEEADCAQTVAMQAGARLEPKGIAGGWGECVRTLKPCPRRAIEYSELGELFSGNLEDKKIESSADEGVAHDTSEGSEDSTWPYV